MFDDFSNKQRRYWPAFLTKVVAVALIFPLIIVTILIILVVLSLKGYI